MLPLHELQSRVMAAILDHSREPAAELIVARGIAPAARLDIYANTARVNFIETLALSFPVVMRLVGADYFRQCGRDYHARHPSRHGDLQHVGAHFAEYLAERHQATEYSYLADVAALEWAYQESLVAADAPPLDLERLATVDPGGHAALRFLTHPAVRWVESAFPIFDIWSSNQESVVEPPLVDLGAGGQRVLIHRSGDATLLRALSRPELVFLRALDAGFAAAVDAAAAADDEFDAADTLRQLVALQVITDFQQGHST
jgi:hypothetical protein